jgi:hypothetical protein
MTRFNSEASLVRALVITINMQSARINSDLFKETHFIYFIVVEFR